MANRLPDEKRKLILKLLCEGNSLRSTSRITGCHVQTIGRLVRNFGDASHVFLDEQLRSLTLRHVEVDEIWTFVQKKQSRLTIEERQTRHDLGDIYLWTVLDADTKLLVSHVVGKRSGDMARRLMKDFATRLVLPSPNDSDRHNFSQTGPRIVVQISSDGFAAYPEAVDLAFGPYVKYGQIIKNYRNANLPYTPSEMVAADRRPIFGMSENEARSIGTSHVERSNLTVRTFMRRFARLSLGFSKKLENLVAASAMYIAHYNFVWRTRYSDNSGKPGKLRPTAAMMAGVTNRLWNFDEFYRVVFHYG
jgi:IS1 family transposase